MRSSAKPFQAMVVVECGAADAFQMTDTQSSAVVAASHSGQPRDTETVAGRLGAGLDFDQLQPGTHPPLHGPTREALEQAGQAPAAALHHNCSGKHCGMLCAGVKGLGYPHLTFGL